MSNKEKIFIIFSPAFPKDGQDSVWLPWLQSLVKAFNKNYPRTRIVIFSFQYPDTSIAYEWNGNLVFPFNGGKRRKAKRVVMWIDIFSRLRKLKKQFDIIGVFSLWCSECTLLAKYYCRFFQLKHYCWVLGQDSRSNNKFIKWINPKPEELVAMSDFLVNEFFKNHHIKPAHVIINAIDPTAFSNDHVLKDIDIIGVGGLSILKRYDMLVEVVAILKNDFPNLKAMLCGDGEDAAHIKQMITDLSLQHTIEMTGEILYTTGLRNMQRSKILLHPSSFEGFSSVCLEALYAGAHVISFIKPMHYDIPNWHIVETKEEMTKKAAALLLNTQTSYESVLIKTFDDVSKEIMQLYGE